MNRILILPGDGIGPEVTREAQRVLEAAARRFDMKLDFETGLIGGASIDASGTPAFGRRRRRGARLPRRSPRGRRRAAMGRWFVGLFEGRLGSEGTKEPVARVGQ